LLAASLQGITFQTAPIKIDFDLTIMVIVTLKMFEARTINLLSAVRARKLGNHISFKVGIVIDSDKALIAMVEPFEAQMAIEIVNSCRFE
jgi:hypothetical protein